MFYLGHKMKTGALHLKQAVFGKKARQARRCRGFSGFSAIVLLALAFAVCLPPLVKSIGKIGEGAERSERQQYLQGEGVKGDDYQKLLASRAAGAGPTGAEGKTGKSRFEIARIDAPESFGSPFVRNSLFEELSSSGQASSLSLENVTVPEGETQIEENLHLGAGTTWTVEGELQLTGALSLDDGASLEVVDGDLVLADGSSLSGSFTFFNSLGSVYFNDDVSITGSSAGLALISDVHVADGVTITVDGSLTIDGSVVDSPGRFNLVVEPTGELTMARTVFDSGDITLNSGATAIYDNSFVNATIVVDATVDGAEIYHNITDDALWLSDNGTNTVTAVDGWANLTDAALTQNNLFLGLELASLPADRTLDPNGNVYIQPMDTVLGTVDVSALQSKIAGVELLMGYNSNLLSAASLGLTADWDVLIDSFEDSGTMIGKIDAALGLSFDFADPAGTSSDQLVGDVELTGQGIEGETLFFHRVKLPDDSFGGETRLTTGGNTPEYLTPFTGNSGLIILDGTVPEIADTAIYASVTQGGADMTLAGAITVQGDLDVTATASDALAGIDAEDAVVTLEGTSGDAVGQTYTATQGGTSTVSVDGEDATEYAFTYAVGPSTLNGTYNVVFTVTDRSGNQSTQALGAIEINKNQLDLEIQLQGLVAGPVTRQVELIFTDVNGAELETRTESVIFTNGLGSVSLTNLDGASYRVSAKTAWNLRGRLEVGFDAENQAAVAFTGAEQLLGGDINGDNAVGTADFSILSFFFNKANAQADITGSGFVGTVDFSILASNFNKLGTDP